MALIKTPDGGFYVQDTDFTVDYNANSIVLVGGAGGSADITADGGTFNADAVLQGTDNLSITVPDTGESASVGITPESVTLVHNTNSEADGSIRVASEGVEITIGEDSVMFNSTGVNFGGMAITNVASIGSIGETNPVAFEEDIDMNNHKITMVANPTAGQDVVNLQYLNGRTATTSTAGLVKQMESIEDATNWTDTNAQTAFNALLAALRTAGILSD